MRKQKELTNMAISSGSVPRCIARRIQGLAVGLGTCTSSEAHARAVEKYSPRTERTVAAEMLSPIANVYVILFVRCAISLILLISAIPKLLDRQHFVEIVKEYRILPDFTVRF